MKNILELTHTEAKDFFLKEESYFNFDLPKYFKFNELLNKLSSKLENKELKTFYKEYQRQNANGTYETKKKQPSNFEGVNYKFLNNKDGKFAWRPFQLINPALYVSLVHKITNEDNWELIVERFEEFRQNPNINCVSLPVKSEDDLSDKATSVSNWWHSIEQKSIELALEYEYILHSDITDCYGSIYTHSVVWALHTKEVAKQKRNSKIIGNIIDWHLQDMSFGQTNGIPQGSVLMDFIAEMVLGYADLKLSEKLNDLSINDYKIIRYRDDYRIFTNNPQKAELILKLITEILIDLNMRLNSQKTLSSNNVVKSSIKPDKLYWNSAKQGAKFLPNHLLLIHELAEKFPNSGSLNKALLRFFYKVYKYNEIVENIGSFIELLMEIAYKNPKTHSIVSKILSEFLAFAKTSTERDEVLRKKQQLLSNNIIRSSIKSDETKAKRLKKRLLLIHELAENFPNSRSLNKSLTKFHKEIELKKIKENTNVLISLLVDIAYKNPRTYPIISAILSEFLAFSATNTERDEILRKIQNKFELIPNTGHLQIWLQRITITFDKNKNYSEKLCQKVYNSSIKLWNVEWLNSDLQNLINNEIIVDETIIEELKPIIEPIEVELFKTDYNY